MFFDDIINRPAIIQQVQMNDREEQKDPIWDVLNSAPTDRISGRSLKLVMEAAKEKMRFQTIKRIPVTLFDKNQFPIMDIEFLGSSADKVKKRVVILSKELKERYKEKYREDIVGFFIMSNADGENRWSKLVPICTNKRHVFIADNFVQYIGNTFLKNGEIPNDIKKSLHDQMKIWFIVQEAMKDPVKKSWLLEHYKEVGIERFDPNTEACIVEGKVKKVYTFDDIPKDPNKPHKKRIGEYVRRKKYWTRSGHWRTCANGNRIWVTGAICGPEREKVLNREEKIDTYERHIVLNPEHYSVDQKKIMEG